MKRILAALLLLGGLSFAAVGPVAQAATAEEELCRGAGMTYNPGTKACNNTQGGPSVEKTIQNVVNVLLFLIGAIAVIMIIIGGLRYVLSGGDQAQISSAKNTIVYACVGLIISIAAYAIVRFVLTYFS